MKNTQQPNSNNNIDNKLVFEDVDWLRIDDAANEESETLKMYSIKKYACKEYMNPENSFMALCSFKGTGKTTLNLLWYSDLCNAQDCFTVYKYDSEISPDCNNKSLTQWIKEWKLKIVQTIISMVLDSSYFSQFSIDQELLIEKCIKSISRTKKMNIFDFIANNIHGETRANDFNTLTSKINKESAMLWLFLDEIDQHFSRNEYEILKITSFLIACNEAANSICNLKIRTTIRPNVWAIVLSKNSALLNLRTSIVQYKWTDKEIKEMIAKRICYYYKTHYLSNAATADDTDWYFHQLFDSNADFDLSKKNVQERLDKGQGQKIAPEKTLTNLGMHRPRWVLSLCRKALQQKIKENNVQKVICKDINDCLPEYGNERLQDLSSEFKSQCSQMNELFASFYKGLDKYKTESILNHLRDKINIDIAIEGVGDKCNAKQILTFLYEIGFIEPKYYKSKAKSEFIFFEDKPNIDFNNEYIWVIQPAFRNALSLSRQQMVVIPKTKGM